MSNRLELHKIKRFLANKGVQNWKWQKNSENFAKFQNTSCFFAENVVQYTAETNRRVLRRFSL